jgi:hypothetical protein
MLHVSIGTACVEFSDKDSDEQALICQGLLRPMLRHVAFGEADGGKTGGTTSRFVSPKVKRMTRLGHQRAVTTTLPS